MQTDTWLARQLKLSIMLETNKTKRWAIALQDRIADCASVGEMLDDGLGYDDIALIMVASGRVFSREHIKAIAKRRVES